MCVRAGIQNDSRVIRIFTTIIIMQWSLNGREVKWEGQDKSPPTASFSLRLRTKTGVNKRVFPDDETRVEADRVMSEIPERTTLIATAESINREQKRKLRFNRGHQHRWIG